MLNDDVFFIYPNDETKQVFDDFIADNAQFMFSREGWDVTCASLLSRTLTYELPAEVEITCPVSCSVLDGTKVFSFGNPDDYDSVIFYIHGGAYVYPIAADHLIFIQRLVRELKVKIVVPLYPLAPESTFEASYYLLNRLYSDLLKEGKPVVLMGESAGGGLALGFTEFLNDAGMPLPSRMILLSPWVDLTMTNPEIPEYEPIDPMLRSYGLVQCGKMWAGDTNPKDYHLSPLYGNLKGLPPTLIYVGNFEIFYPDNYRLYELLKSQNVPVLLYIGDKLGHTYPRYVREDNPQYREILQPLFDFVRGV